MNRSARGFTLIEVLVVVGIIALLVLIAVPTFMTHVDITKAKATRIFFQTLSVEIERYKSDLGVYPPSSLPGRPLGPGSELLREALVTGLGNTGKGNARWDGPYAENAIPPERIGRASGSVPSYTSLSVTYADGSTPGNVDGVLLDDFNRMVFYVNNNDYDRFGVRIDTLTLSGSGETSYEYPTSFQLLAVGKDGKTTPNQIGAQSMFDNIDNDSDSVTDGDDTERSTQNGTLPEDDITR